MMNDYVCCEVLEVIADTDKMVCGMKGTTRKPGDPEHRPALGLIGTDDFPIIYKYVYPHYFIFKQFKIGLVVLYLRIVNIFQLMKYMANNTIYFHVLNYLVYLKIYINTE